MRGQRSLRGTQGLVDTRGWSMIATPPKVTLPEFS